MSIVQNKLVIDIEMQIKKYKIELFSKLQWNKDTPSTLRLMFSQINKFFGSFA